MQRRALLIAAVLSIVACSPGSTTSPSPAASPSAAGSPSPEPSGSPSVADLCRSVASPTLDAIRDRGALRWATGIFAPYAYKDPQGKYQGIEVDNAADFAGVLGVDPEVHDYSYEVIVATVQTREADIVGASLFATDARREVIDFSDPYYTSGQVFVVLANRDDLSTIDDLNSADVTYVGNIGSPVNDIAKAVLPNATQNLLTGSGDFQNLYPQLQAGQADVFLIDDFLWPTAKKAFPDLKAIGRRGVVTDPVPVSEDVVGEYDIAFGVAKGDAGYLECLNGWVADLTSSGRFVERFKEWVEKNAQGQ